jgi:hypothetical protein
VCALANRKIIARDECAGVRATSNLRALVMEKLTPAAAAGVLYMLGDTREIIDGCDKIDDRKQERKKHAIHAVCAQRKKRACMVGCILPLLHILLHWRAAACAILQSDFVYRCDEQQKSNLFQLVI